MERASNKGMFIDDIQLREDHGAEAEQIIADLDAGPSTQKGKATRHPEARFNPAVEKYLALRAAQAR